MVSEGGLEETARTDRKVFTEVERYGSPADISVCMREDDHRTKAQVQERKTCEEISPEQYCLQKRCDYDFVNQIHLVTSANGLHL